MIGLYAGNTILINSHILESESHQNQMEKIGIPFSLETELSGNATLMSKGELQGDLPRLFMERTRKEYRYPSFKLDSV